MFVPYNNIVYDLVEPTETPDLGKVRANDEEFPHMVAIGYEDSENRKNWVCGGTLISDSYILTAAICAKPSK